MKHAQRLARLLPAADFRVVTGASHTLPLVVADKKLTDLARPRRSARPNR